jgi:putative sigma-54 modulation protein
MHINTTARHFELAPDDRQFAHARIEKFSRFVADIKSVHLVVTAESFRYIAEATLSLNQRELVVSEEATDPRRAIDLLADRVELQLRRLHDKRVDHKRAPRANGETELAPADGDDESGDAGED